MSENVVALPGYQVPTPQGEPVESVVGLAKKILAMAEAGELVALHACYVFDDGSPSVSVRHLYEFRAGNGLDLAAAASLGHKRLLERMFE